MTPTMEMDLPDQLENEAEGTEDENARHPDEPKANVFGIYVDGVETITIDLPKSYKATAELQVVQGTDGLWHSSYNYSHSDGGGGSMPSFTRELDPKYDSREFALYGAASDLLATVDKKGQKKLAEKIAAFRKSIEPPGAIDAEFEVVDDEPTKPAKKTADEKALAKAEKHYLTRKREAEEGLSQAVLHRRECEAQLKAAKSDEKSAATLLESILGKGVERLPLIEAAEKVAEERAEAEEGLSQAQPASDATATTTDPDAWKSVSITELGLHPSLAEKLAGDGIDTIGRLEKRREDISHGREKWPKGIGKAKITQIEDAVIGWLTENQPAAPTEPTEEQLKQAIVARAAELNTGDSDTLEPAGDTDDQWDSGLDAHGRGLKVTDCPYVAGVEQDDWLKGWLSANDTEKGETVSGDLSDL